MGTITITLHKNQITIDILALTSQIASQYEDNPETARMAGEIKTPDSEELKPIVARSLTEAFSNIKMACARYLARGREADENNLEEVSGVFILELNTPHAFNKGIVETLKSAMHRYMVDYTMAQLLINPVPKQAEIYGAKAQSGLNSIIPMLNSRTSFTRRCPSFT